MSKGSQRLAYLGAYIFIFLLVVVLVYLFAHHEGVDKTYRISN